jgi:hypothetical protein
VLNITSKVSKNTSVAQHFKNVEQQNPITTDTQPTPINKHVFSVKQCILWY